LSMTIAKCRNWKVSCVVAFTTIVQLYQTMWIVAQLKPALQRSCAGWSLCKRKVSRAMAACGESRKKPRPVPGKAAKTILNVL
jgi:hypothetical protein